MHQSLDENAWFGLHLLALNKPQEAIERMRVEMERVRAQGSRLELFAALTHTALALWTHDLDWSEAERLAREALEIQESAACCQLLAAAAVRRGEVAEGRAWERRAEQSPDYFSPPALDATLAESNFAFNQLTDLKRLLPATADEAATSLLKLAAAMRAGASPNAPTASERGSPGKRWKPKIK